MFGTIGVASSIGELSSAIVSLDASGSSKAGEATKYGFSFKVATKIPFNSFFRFTIPNSGFDVSQFPSCSQFAINNNII